MKFQEFMDKSHLMTVYLDYHRSIPPLTKELKKAGLNLFESLVLSALFFEQGSPVSPGELQNTLRIAKDQVSHALKVLEKEGLLERHVDKGDNRKRQLSITPKGKQLALQLIKVFNHAEDELDTHRNSF